MPANPSGIKGISTLFSFTPRQVLLTMKNAAAADNGTLSSEHNQKQKLLLHQSIALYFERAGFSKSLKKFLSEAKIEKDSTEGLSVDLEEMCRKYLETCKDAKSTINDDQKEEVAAVHSKPEGEKSKGKKKKKSNLVSEAAVSNLEDNQLELPTMFTENKVDLSTVAKVDNGAETEKRSKQKTKKNNKSNIEGDATEQIAVTENKVKDDLSIDAKVENGAETEKKSKRKIKKKDKSNSEGDSKEQIGEPDTTVLKKENSKATNEEAMPEKKDSKKRKRTASKENDEQDTEVKEDEETKRRKVENLNETQGGDQSAKTNGHYENGEEKSSVQKSQKKKNKESAEQKAVKVPFQRVQVDKIDFEKIHDNSYWAKDGAESGYGAKAEEILGQVRGKDFRHEKTKKKRGTYRGGHIDLQAHSVKFNYSDEE